MPQTKPDPVSGSDTELSDLHTMQRLVTRLALRFVDGDGETRCKIEADVGDSPEECTAELVKQWASIHDHMIFRLGGIQLGCLSEGEIEQMDMVLGMGTILLSIQKMLMDKGVDVADTIIDLTASLRSFNILRESYDSNSKNEELDQLAAVHSEVPVVQELADLFLDLLKPFGDGQPGDSGAFEEALAVYLNDHPHLKEVYPDVSLRRVKLLEQVRAFARKKLKEEAAADGTGAASAVLAELEKRHS